MHRLCVEGNATTAFGSNNFRYLCYGGGPKVSWRQRKFEPWVHALVGGVHLLPQTANASQGAFATQIGGGVDYRFYPHLSARVGADWVRSHMFAQWQNGIQTAVDIVLHF